MPTVRFRNMWRSFDPAENSLVDMLRATLEGQLQVVQSPFARVDIEVCSVFTPFRSRLSAASRVLWSRSFRKPKDRRLAQSEPIKSASADVGIWYTGENVRPPASGWDLTLSFDQTTNAIRNVAPNVYLPLWQLGTDLFGGRSKGFLGVPTRVAELASPRESRVADRAGFCCAFIRNPDPVRLRAISALSNLGRVDVYGMVGGIEVSTKVEVARDYRFVLCFENDLYPGYVTEKLTDAWLTGAVPLWWGVDTHGYFNQRAIVNFAMERSLEEFVELVRLLDSDPARLNAVGSTPLLKRLPSDKELLAAFADLGLPAKSH